MGSVREYDSFFARFPSEEKERIKVIRPEEERLLPEGLLMREGRNVRLVLSQLLIDSGEMIITENRLRNICESVNVRYTDLLSRFSIDDLLPWDCICGVAVDKDHERIFLSSIRQKKSPNITTTMFNKNVWVYVTRECNLACPYCYNKINASASLMHDRNVASRVKFLLNKLLAEGRMERIMLTGGEPMLAKETYNLIDSFRGKVRLAIYTNGTLLSYENVKRLAGVEVKISLHGTMGSIDGLKRYADMIPILESENISYGFIYMVTAENYKHLHDAYLFLRSKSKYGGFSMKYQPLVVQKDESIENNKLLEIFSLCNLSLPEWNILEKEIQKTILYEDNNPLPNKNPIFLFDESAMKYFFLLRDFYLYGKKPLTCNNVPIIIIGSDGHVRPCMFRFDRIISSATGQETPYGDLIHDMSPDEVEKMRCAQCFSEQCVCALKPTT